jgi:hypothetical protein
MRYRNALSTSFWVVLFGLLLIASTTLRADDGGDGRPERRVVVVDDNGQEHVFESGQPLKTGYLGVGLVELTPELRTHFGVPESAGVMVSHVEAGSPAEKAGVQVGDIITNIDGKSVDSSWALRDHIRELEDGANVALEVKRGKQGKTLNAAIEKRDHLEVDMSPMFMKKLGDEKTFMMRNGAGMPLLVPPRGREADLEKRLKDLEQRLKDLEAKLPKQ